MLNYFKRIRSAYSPGMGGLRGVMMGCGFGLQCVRKPRACAVTSRCLSSSIVPILSYHWPQTGHHNFLFGHMGIHTYWHRHIKSNLTYYNWLLDKFIKTVWPTVTIITTYTLCVEVYVCTCACTYKRICPILLVEWGLWCKVRTFFSVLIFFEC